MSEVGVVTSKSNPLLVRLRKLVADPGGYRHQGEVWLEGEHLCAAYLQRGGVPLHALITEAGWQRPALRRLASAAVQVARVSPAAMASIGGMESPPPIGFVIAWPQPEGLQPHAPSLVLDRLQDPGNAGTILRSAAAFGITQVLALKGTVALWSPKVLRAGMGAHFSLRVVEALADADLAALHVPLLATSSHASAVLHEVALPWPSAWVFGHEGQGIAPALQARCATVLRIAQPGGQESLNVAAAAAVCLYESARQRSVHQPVGP
jgi:TrmH family RNA methyltransferase